MKKFKYRLQRVLRFKESEKKGRERELALKSGELFAAESKLEEIIRRQDEVTLPEAGQMTMAEISIQREFQESLRAMLEEQRLLILEAASAVDQARNAYLEKAVETETLTTHRKRQLDNYKVDSRREGRRVADELTIQRFKRVK